LRLGDYKRKSLMENAKKKEEEEESSEETD